MTPANAPLTAAATVLQPLLVYLEQRGFDTAPVLKAAGLARGQAAAPTVRVPEPAVRAAWAAAIAQTGDPSIGLQVGRIVVPQAFGVMGYVLANAPTVGQTLRAMSRYHRLLFDEPLLLQTRSGDEVALHLRRDPHADPETNRPVVEFLIASLLRLAGTLAASRDLAASHLRAVHFRHARPDAALLPIYAELFDPAPLHFDSQDNRLVVDAGALALPVAFADPLTLEQMSARARRELRELATETEPHARAAASIRRRLLGRAPTIAEVARDCGLSRATLQRRLSEAGTSFSGLLESIRADSARELLADPALSIDEIAGLLGYGDAASFHHAFKRWTGQTPGTWRAAQAGN